MTEKERKLACELMNYLLDYEKVDSVKISKPEITDSESIAFVVLAYGQNKVFRLMVPKVDVEHGNFDVAALYQAKLARELAKM